MTLRLMTAGDLPAVCAIERLVQYAPWSERLFLDGLERGHLCQVAAPAAGAVAGFAVTQFVLDEAHLLNIAVDPARQRGGIGRQLLDRVILEAGGRGAATLFLEVRAGNERAIRLYQMAGFNEIGLRKHYYPGPDGKEHALMMALML